VALETARASPTGISKTPHTGTGHLCYPLISRFSEDVDQHRCFSVSLNPAIPGRWIALQVENHFLSSSATAGDNNTKLDYVFCCLEVIVTIPSMLCLPPTFMCK
jgi:hypothetical protein